MTKKLFGVLVLFSILFFLTGCASRQPVYKSRLERLYENNFEGLRVPTAYEIKNRGKRESKSFPYATYDEVWDATIIVLLQEAIILRASKDSGVIVTVPKQPYVVFPQIFFRNPASAIFIENGEAVTIYLSWMEWLYIRGAKLPPDAKENMAKPFFDKLATQLYAGEKWKYLYK